MAVNDASVVEGNTGTTAKFTVTRSGSTSAAASVSYMTLKETAVSGSDFAMIYMTTLNFAPGETTKTVDVSNGAGKTTTLRTISGLLH
ncbi:MAG: Calx-beta domain-containing protein, partial [Acidimicrobiales bacterium]